MASFNLTIYADKATISNPSGTTSPSEDTLAANRRKTIASLLRISALMLEQGRDAETLRDHLGHAAGTYVLDQEG